MIVAARIGKIFGMSPLDVLDRDDIDFAILLAAARRIGQDEQESQHPNKSTIFDADPVI